MHPKNDTIGDDYQEDACNRKWNTHPSLQKDEGIATKTANTNTGHKTKLPKEFYGVIQEKMTGMAAAHVSNEDKQPPQARETIKDQYRPDQAAQSWRLGIGYFSCM